MMRWAPIGTTVFAVALLAASPARGDEMPDCSDIERPAIGATSDCRTVSTDRLGLTFEGHTTTVGPHSYRTAVTVIAPGRGSPQVITEDTDHDYGPRYLLRDLDADGRDELLIITDSGGTGGETMTVWRARGEETTYAPAGEVFGFRTFWQTADGFTAQYAHLGARAGTVTLSRFVDDHLVTVAELRVQAADWADPPGHVDWETHGATKCALSEDDYPPGALAARTAALRDAGIDPAGAQHRFCAEPWVASLYDRSGS
ncbi:hypothetical protein BHQ15_09590 [Mycolicibacillus koreensis]|nr:hypothetical protein BHQ15_09590 [Mycolicibacillus koreensis]